MTVEKMEEIQPIVKQIMDMLESHLGTKTELVLHDAKDYTKTIIDIRNGHITGRTVGGCGSELGLQAMRGTMSMDSCINSNYINYTRDGTILRSSTLYFKNSNGDMVGSLCINTDITDSIKFENFLREYNNYDPNAKPVNEIYVPDIQQLLDELIKRAFNLTGKTAEEMTREDKIAFIKFLDSKGAFFISKSSERIWEILNISKYTFYSYLEMAREE